ncbi:MAG TPA: M1 family metallopeptidase, partial [Candidatus Kapabacteria bacterium]
MRFFLFLTILVGLEAVSFAILPTYAQTSATGIPYFQQHVHYTLAATFHDDYSTPSIDGDGTLEYTNNSPDTLTELYFHLYWNLFTSGSYGERAPERNQDPGDKYGHGGIEIKSLSLQYLGPKDNPYPVNNPRATNSDPNPSIEVDNTILLVRLRVPLPPGEMIGVHFDWHGILPNYGIRSTWGWHDGTARDFSTAQWYPQICVYDNHGWHPDQYIGMGEFYTDYGSFDVSLTVPERFSTLVSTGWQINPQETLSIDALNQLQFAKAHPDSIVRIADHSNFPYTRITDNEATRTWKFHADSVRDFAWCADEAAIWDAVYDGGVMHHALYWKNSREFWSAEAAKIVLLTEQTNSAFAGKYMYPNMYMCETYEGGMEYPGIVFVGPYQNGTTYHYPQNTMMHELGHEWYPMMMGSNETDYGYMDEGFNTFITTFVQEKYFGRWNNSYGPGLGFNDDERTANYRSSILQQLSGNAEPSKQKADMFLSYHDYAEATYPHTSSVFFMLRYTMGDTAFADFMKLYYSRWRFKHPYPDDLENAAEDIERREGDTNRVRARGDLRWFFNEWFEQTWKLDYAIGKFSVLDNTASVTIDRKERAVMPLDLVFYFKDGTSEQKWIPVDDWLRTVADERTYTYTFSKEPTGVVINPSSELLDVNRLNNATKPELQIDLMPKIFGDIKPIDKYALRTAPFIAPETGDFRNLALGYTLLGSYLGRTNRTALGVRFGIGSNSYSTGVYQFHTVMDALSPW